MFLRPVMLLRVFISFTLGLNLLVFVAAFAAQWAIGLIINLWPQTASGSDNVSGYKTGFGLIMTLQLAAAIWYFVSTGRKTNTASETEYPF